jgi:multidrug resistance efflux pump
MTRLRSSPRIRIITLALLVVVGGGIGLHNVVLRASAAPNTPLVGSGTIEATIVTLSPQLAGRVAEVMVQEGDTVAAGDVLLTLDDMGLQSQRRSAVLAATAAQAAAQAELEAAQQALKGLQDNAPVVTAQAALALANARKALDDAQRHRSYQAKGNRASSETIAGTEADLTLANEKVSDAEDAVSHVSNLAPDDPKRAAAEAALYDARHARDVIQATLNWYTGSPTDFDQAILDAQVDLDQATVNQAEADFAKVRLGPDPDALRLAQTKIAAAQAGLDAAKAQGDAAVQAIDLQLEKLEVRSSTSGVILVRNIEPGETTVPGAALFQIGQLSALEITVYLPEEQYALVKPGEQAQVRVDAYPDRIFNATVLRIADQAEFTPRNVQTVEGRKDTVYAIRLSIANPDTALKPGMPADVSFGQG